MMAVSVIGKGAQAQAIHAKGLELSAHEPRGAKSMGAHYATASIEASHCYGYGGKEVFGGLTPERVA